ncbi:hypothetical protein F442_19610 [Phytophthora nicotianae P10297]|uniref:Uncharacterized protein n=2 Tax=Phytophthora nicotianae TaxID=4792 RepID=V9DSR5_PHYNI|nr:hypothetical protein F443_22978 [Phytophthora nicotianae P1569]ETP31529.1 hypothetical protein F442_19610 [Phytophthora nicotianae P10297]
MTNFGLALKTMAIPKISTANETPDIPNSHVKP